jgi:DNA-binding transcriptional LysR family regulator
MHEWRGTQAFAAVAEHGSFSAAARAQGLTASALSQAVRSLEDRLGLPLFVRSTRSVRLTEAGERLYARLVPALRETADALEEVRGSRGAVRGTLRISLGRLTVPMVIEPVLPRLLALHPELQVEFSVEDRFVDIVAAGLDAGIRLSESIQPDFTMARLTPPFRLVVAGAPSYFERYGRPRRPSDLLKHDCINYRMGASGAFYSWEFERNGREQQVAVRGRVACNDGLLMLNAGLSGLGLIYLHEPAVASHVERGELELVLVDYAPRLPGFFLYYPQRSGAQAKLRAFIDVAQQVLLAKPPRGGHAAPAARLKSRSRRVQR